MGRYLTEPGVMTYDHSLIHPGPTAPCPGSSAKPTLPLEVHPAQQLFMGGECPPTDATGWFAMAMATLWSPVPTAPREALRIARRVTPPRRREVSAKDTSPMRAAGRDTAAHCDLAGDHLPVREALPAGGRTCSILREVWVRTLLTVAERTRALLAKGVAGIAPGWTVGGEDQGPGRSGKTGLGANPDLPARHQFSRPRTAKRGVPARFVAVVRRRWSPLAASL